MLSDEKLCQLARHVIHTETQAITQLEKRIDANFARACQLILGCKGRLVVLGMGKSGHIAHKIAATLASTGSPAFFVHPSEASHGDLGMITRDDVVIVLSNSGETDEILTLLPSLKRLAIPIISISGKKTSSLARAATVNLDTSVDKEACSLDLAPTSSTTAMLVMGDALAITLLEARGFTADDFAFIHPGGTLGRRLLVKTTDLMRTGNAIPSVVLEAPLSQALVEMTQKGLGMTLVVDAEHNLCGVYTDGDVRRTLDRRIDIHNTSIEAVMTKTVKTIEPDLLAIDALNIMERYKITTLAVVDENNIPIGVLHLHDLLRAGIV